MSIDERFEWIGNNLESLHVSSQELHASVSDLRDTVREMNETTNERFRTLVRVLELHEQRIQALEGGTENR